MGEPVVFFLLGFASCALLAFIWHTSIRYVGSREEAIRSDQRAQLEEVMRRQSAEMENMRDQIRVLVRENAAYRQSVPDVPVLGVPDAEDISSGA